MAAGLMAASWVAVAPARAQEVTKENVDGIVNFHRLETTVACAGAIKPQVVPDIKKYGFVSIINLREATEPRCEPGGRGRCRQSLGPALLQRPVQRHEP